MTAEQFEDRLAAALVDTLCGATFECDPPDYSYIGLGASYSSASDCRENYPKSPSFVFLRDSLFSGSENTTFDEGAAASCLETFERADSCNVTETFFLAEGACDDVFVGTIAAGGACASGDECADGGECVFGDDPCVGTCEADDSDDLCGGQECADDQVCLTGDDGAQTCTTISSVAAGGFCGGQIEVCARGLLCNSSSRSCEEPPPLLARGEECAPAPAPGGTQEYCAPGLVCVDVVIDGFMASGVCGDLKEEGDACGFATECKPGLVCLGWEAAFQGGEVGSVCGTPRADGSSCEYDSECASFSCAEGTCAGAASACP